jgi:hypothetical protein
MSNIFLISFIVYPIIIFLLLRLYNSYQKLKKSETENLNLLKMELDSEKKKANQLKNISEKIKKTNNSTHLKLLKIRVDIFNIDFTLSEVFK